MGAAEVFPMGSFPTPELSTFGAQATSFVSAQFAKPFFEL